MWRWRWIYILQHVITHLSNRKKPGYVGIVDWEKLSILSKLSLRTISGDARGLSIKKYSAVDYALSEM
ncbi:uncharacterized protein CANTADRAFT_244278 [Suhomyces tanzawaensis NRRL Y-17324]|uniref:Uncharacterized protein n=1 Tax=Suhomyces tanzawaensis NRRL Y-17324 TaxID=984487 RepID=A0A1E4SHT4_9ASCO|nr:uncharacterized protein CANTADRAFT_244278 [Suhomyces tanzawaensis NRRL Y-17324]ODV79056.1 hypothetical protein CANTADRAFT_244278 [Suhomyces tanzawaensis NRRL Y-17324]